MTTLIPTARCVWTRSSPDKTPAESPKHRTGRAAAVALHEGFHYQPDSSLFWKQSVGSENSYLFVTTRHLNSTYLDSIKDTMEEGEYLIIACRSFDSGLDKAYGNITVKKIPQMLLDRCEFGKTDYNLNIVHPPVYDDEAEEEEQDE